MADKSSSGTSPVSQILAGTIVTTTIGTIFAFARFYTRTFITKNLGRDDLFILLAWIFAIVLTSLNFVLAGVGSGPLKINPSIPYVDNFRYLVTISYISQLVYQFILWTTKVGVCFFYLRIFDGRSTKWILYSVITAVSIAFIVIELLSAFRCTPLSDIFDISKLNSSSCLPNHQIVYASAITNVCGDLFLMAFVIPHFLKLKLPWKQKALLILIVSLGLLVVTAAIVRLVRVVADHPKPSAASDIIIWSSIEVYTGIFCASAPCIRPLIRQLAPNIFLSGTGSRPSNSHMLGNYIPKSMSRRRQEEFELNSSTEDIQGQPRFNGSSIAWARGNRRSAVPDDDDSKLSPLPLKPDSTHIMKTVKVSVNHGI